MAPSFFLLVLIALFLVSIPVAFALGITSTLLMAITGGGIRFGVIIQRMVGGVNTFTLLAVPMFLLAGKLMNATGITDRLFNFAKVLVGWLPGGLGQVNVMASVVFAGKTATAVSDISALGAVQIRAMTNAGFDRPFSCAVSAASSTLGPVFPPSLPMIVYGSIAGVSIGALFIAGILPAVLMALLMMIVVFIYSLVRKYPREKFPTPKELGRSFVKAIPPLLAPVILFSGIYGGLFTPTEAAVVLVFYALFLGMVVYRTINLKGLWGILVETAIDAASIGIIVAAATLFGDVVIRTLIPQHLVEVISGAITNPLVLLLVVNLMMLVLGLFLETIAAITITVPLLMPLILAAGIDPVHFGVILVLNLMISVLTPPFGIVLFVCSYIGKISVSRLSVALLPWILALFVALMIITYVPQISLFLPRLAGLIN
ncbi:MAG: TRAP transporter large permease [Treponema sp.]|nr:TRAP transporter large permease [Treponema sp.]